MIYDIRYMEYSKMTTLLSVRRRVLGWPLRLKPCTVDCWT